MLGMLQKIDGFGVVVVQKHVAWGGGVEEHEVVLGSGLAWL